MALANDLSNLPKANREVAGEPPDPNPRFVQLLVAKMAAANEKAGTKPTAMGTRVRHSDAGKCARAIAYTAAGVERSDPMDLPGVWVTSLGTLIHEAWQEALLERFPNATIETKLRIDGLDASGHADAIIDIEGYDNLAGPHDGETPAVVVPPKRILFELKTCGGFSYKMKVGERGNPEGPSHEHKLQAALNGLAVDADEIVIGYIATEAISKPAASRKKIDETTRFCAEWSYTREEFEPWARAEQARLQGVLDLLDDGLLAARKFATPELPVGHEIVDPKSGRWEVRKDDQIVDTGTFWACNYCSFQSLCVTTESGRIPVTAVTVRTAA
jgi:hypothetical protein